MDAKSSGAAGYSTESGRHSGTTLTDAARGWPTPRSGKHGDPGSGERHPTIVSMWPTPRTLTGGAESAERKRELGREESGGGDLQSAAKLWPTPTVPSGGRVNPPGTSDTGVTPDGIKKQVDLQEIARRWPTPMGVNRTSEKAKTGRPTSGPSRGGPSVGLEDVAQNWRTPDCGGGSSLNGSGTKRNPLLAQQANLWATPRAEERQQKNSRGAHEALSRQVLTTETAGEPGSKGAVLNPCFVEALMGLPPSWTVPTGFDVSGTPSSPRKPKRRSRCSRSES